jgi:hypothetical protein
MFSERGGEMKRFALIMVVLTGLAVGCGSDGGGSASGQSSPRPIEEDASKASSPQDPGALEGTWSTGVVTRAEIEAMLREQGLEKWIQPLRGTPEGDPIADRSVYTLTIRGGNWDLDTEANGKAPVPMDFGGQYEIDGDTVTNEHAGEGFNTYRWEVNGDTLTLIWLDTNFGPSYGDIPEEVLQRAIYQTVPFERQS